MNTVQHHAHHKQSGFGLVEILVALTLSMFLMAGIFQVYLANKQSYRMTEGLSRMQENARYALKSLDLNLQPGGFRGCLGDNPLHYDNNLTEQSPSSDYNFVVSVTGTEGGSNADTVTLRRAIGGAAIDVVEPMAHKADSIKLNANDPDYARLEQYQILTVSDCEVAAVFMITNDPQAAISGGVGTIEHKTGIVAPTGGPNPGQSNNDEFLGQIFGAKTTSVARTYSSVSVTYRLDTGTGGRQSLFAGSQELVEGVQDFQVTYGLPDGNGNIQYLSASSLGQDDWPEVETLRVALTLDTVEDVTSNGTIEKNFGRTFRVRNRNP
jgi:type IV pilus assembly protein PilW